MPGVLVVSNLRRLLRLGALRRRYHANVAGYDYESESEINFRVSVASLTRLVALSGSR